MKKFRKIMAVLVAAIMIMATMVPAWATTQTGEGSIYASTPTKGKITITNPTVGETYKAYKMLSLISYNDNANGTHQHSTDAYSYGLLSTSKWLSFFTSGEGKKYITLDTNNPVTIKIGSTDYTYYIASPNTADVSDGAGGYSSYNFKNPFANGVDNGSLDENTEAMYPSTALVQKFAQAALKYVSDNSTDFGSGKADAPKSQGPVAVGTTSVEFDNLDLGYYLVDSTLGTLCTLDTTNNTVNIVDKNEDPASIKKVQEDDADDVTIGDAVNGYQDVNDATINQVVWFKDVIDIEKGAERYIYADRMANGLSFNSSSVTVYYVPNGEIDTFDSWIPLVDKAAITLRNAGGSDETYLPTGKSATTAIVKGDFYSTETTAANFKSTWTDSATNGTTDFEVVFVQEFLTFLSDHILGTKANDTSKFVVCYSATVTNSALASASNVNESKLLYGNDSHSETEPSRTVTYTWPIEIFKYEDNSAKYTGSTYPGNAGKGGLEGAVFKLSDDEAGTKAYNDTATDGVYMFKLMTSNADPEYLDGYVGNQYKVVPKNEENALDVVTTPASGKIRIVGLDSGEYYLTETIAPNGYNKLPYPVKVKISTDIDDESETTDTITETVQWAFKSRTGSAAAAYEAYGDTAKYETTGAADPSFGIQIPNTTTTELPSTGGMGTTVLYIVGGMLVILAGAYLFFSRKRTA